MNSIINFSEATLLAIHSIGLIAKSKDKKLNTCDIAGMLNASKNHLSKIHQRLVKLGFIKSTRGPSGGFIIGQDPGNIFLLEIVEAFEGKIIFDDCSLKLPQCAFGKCIFGIHKNIFNEFYDFLKGKRLSEII